MDGRDSKEACGETCDSTLLREISEMAGTISEQPQGRQTASIVEQKQQNVVYLQAQSQNCVQDMLFEFKPCSEDYVGGLNTRCGCD